MKTKPSKRRILVLVLCCVFVVSAAASFLGRHLLTDSPFKTTHAFYGPTSVFAGASKRVYIVDEGKKSVLVINEAGEFERKIEASADGSGGFYYASLVCEGEDGAIYIADTLYSGAGTILKAERVFRYDANGANPKLIYEIQYDDPATAPLQYGNIASIYEADDTLFLGMLAENGVQVATCDVNTGMVTATPYALENAYISDVCINPDTYTPVYVTRFGEVCAIGADGAITTLVSIADGRTAWRVACDGENVYYTDLATNGLLCVSLATGEETVMIEGDSILYTAFERDGRIYTTDYMGYYVYDDGAITYSLEAPLSQLGLRIAVWGAVFIAALLGAALIVLLIIRKLFRRSLSATLQRVMIVLLVSVCIGALVASITLKQTVESQNGSIMEHLSLFDDILVETTDVEALKRIDSLDDYKGADYNKVKEPLDALMRMTYDNGLYYYYIIYTTDGETIYGVMDYEETMTTRHPFYPYGTEGYTEPLEGETVEFSADVSSYGSWAFVLKPIVDASGASVAMMEVGVNLDDMNAQIRALVWKTILTTAAMAVVLLMLIIETILYIEHRERKHGLAAAATTIERFPLRSLIFLTFLADCMQDAFVSILANRLYVPFWGIPQSVGAALPLSAQVLAAALSAFACGSVARRYGVRRALTVGFILETAGFIVCGAMATYTGLLAGKLLIGAGIGLILVSVNSVAASGASERESAHAFASINAGTLAGVTAGAGVGSVILSFGGFQLVYYSGAVILLLGLVVAMTGADYRETIARGEREKRGAGLMRLIRDRRVWSFLLLILMPFLIALSFREYFFPIFAEENGITEADIGRIYLLCGLVVIYFGPFLTKRLIERLGSKWTVVTASVLMLMATLLFAMAPTIVASVAGLALLSMATSFGYAAQATYYAGLEGVAKYGESRSMGVHSLFDNGGQTIGPVIYGVAMMAGYREGLLMIGAGLAALVLVFVVINGFGAAKQKEKHGKEIDA